MMTKTYQETLDFIYSQLPMYQQVGKVALKKNLDNIKLLCKNLDSPEKKFRSIHIAGTNGKGSVTHILAAVLKKAGYRVACYTSPHYIDFRERIKILSQENGVELIPKQNVIDFVSKNEAIIAEIKPSFFEMTVAMAFDFFAQQKIDIAIIETGLGGRLDSTNIIKPILSIITNISKDHTQFLGNTLKEIAREKAGIIKEEVPVIIGKKQKSTRLVFQEKAEKNSSPIYFAQDLLKILEYKSKLGKKTRFEIKVNNNVKKLKTDLFGKYQKENLTTALSALYFLKKIKAFHFKNNALQEALLNIKKHSYFIGRNTILSQNPLSIADSAHNEAGIHKLVKQIAQLNYHKIHFVYGTVSDKDITSIFKLFSKKMIFYFCKPNVIRGMDLKELNKIGHQLELDFSSHSTVEKAYQSAQNCAQPNDLIIVSGSIFVVAEVLSFSLNWG